MQEFIHRMNLEHYRQLLAGTTLDKAARRYVATLLTDEEAKEVLPLKPRDGD